MRRTRSPAGIVSRVNKAARAAGCGEGMPCLDAALALRDAPPPSAAPEYAEARHVVGRTQAGLRLVCMDSISLVAEGEDDGQIVLSGSHCGLVASQPHFVIGVDAAAAFFNDAGIGKDGAGITRLPALDARGIAGATVAAMSARIGDGRSTYSDGIVSRVNETARAAGIEPGMTAREAVDLHRNPGRRSRDRTFRILAFAGMTVGGVPAGAVRTIIPTFAGMTHCRRLRGAAGSGGVILT